MQENSSHKPAAPGSHQSTKKAYGRHARISRFIKQIYSGDMLQLFAGCCQLGLGISVVIATVLGFVRPLWLSTLLNIFASVTTITGIYVCYKAISGWNKDTLLRDAMRRIVEDQN